MQKASPMCLHTALTKQLYKTNAKVTNMKMSMAMCMPRIHCYCYCYSRRHHHYQDHNLYNECCHQCGCCCHCCSWSRYCQRTPVLKRWFGDNAQYAPTPSNKETTIVGFDRFAICKSITATWKLWILQTLAMVNIRHALRQTRHRRKQMWWPASPR